MRGGAILVFMPRFVPDPEVLRLGEALAALRRERGLSQAEAGARLDMTSQGWGLYESGRRQGLFRPDVQRRLTGALGSTPEALALLASGAAAAPSAAETGVESRGRRFDPDGAAVLGRLTLFDDALAPWAARGVVLEYRADLAPRPGQGCVVILTDGTLLPRLFERSDADGVHVRGAGGLDKAEILHATAIAKVCAVVARHEP